jgi:hypothetical protein
MKKTAFAQALLIVLLLTASWFLFLKKSQKQAAPAEPAVVVEAPAEVPETSPEADPVEAATPPVAEVDKRPLPKVPPQWQEWMDYLQQQTTPGQFQDALGLLRDSIFSMEQQDASARLIELILSGVDLETGMVFKVGPGGKLASSPTLHVFLLDWLGQLDPQRAAGIASLALNAAGTRLSPDRYVMHLRNYALGTPPGDSGKQDFLRNNFNKLLEEKAWMDSPTNSIAESMDIAVYLGDPALVPAMARLTTDEMSPALRHASSLALERLIDQSPAEAIGQLISTPGGQSMPPETRAGFVARIDPVDAAAKSLLKTYLASSETSREEATLFLAHFPNMNQSLSHNLLSNNNSNTESVGHLDRLQRALEQVETWQADSDISGLDEALADSQSRLVSQLTGAPAP